jgi:hypothetical protein
VTLTNGVGDVGQDLGQIAAHLPLNDHGGDHQLEIGASDPL